MRYMILRNLRKRSESTASTHFIQRRVYFNGPDNCQYDYNLIVTARRVEALTCHSFTFIYSFELY